MERKEPKLPAVRSIAWLDLNVSCPLGSNHKTYDKGYGARKKENERSVPELDDVIYRISVRRRLVLCLEREIAADDAANRGDKQNHRGYSQQNPGPS